MSWHAADGCPRCQEAAERAHAMRLTVAAQTILADPAAFFDAHPEIVSAAYAHTEQKRQGPVWVTPRTKGGGS